MPKREQHKSPTRISDPQAAIRHIFSVLMKGDIARDDITARKVSYLLGQTTGYLYHHFHSFDGFIVEVTGLGWSSLVTDLEEALAKHGRGAALVNAYIEFALVHPTLYWLMAERPLNPELVRERSRDDGKGLPSYAAWLAFLALVGKIEPKVDPDQLRMKLACMHGICSQALSGRLNALPGAVESTEDGARDLAGRLGAVLWP